MILRYLKLDNIRSYVHEKITFPAGSLMLAGDIGSGKSTILMALEFALFGIIKGNINGESLLRKGAKTGEIELCFFLNKKEYIIKRTLQRSKQGVIAQNSGYLIIDGMKTDATPIELKAKVLSILGYPKELLSKSKSLIFRYTVYTPQENMKSILSEDSEMRLDTLRRVFGIDRYKRVKENTELISREFRRRIKSSEENISDLDEKKRSLDDEKVKLKIIKEKEHDLKDALDLAKKDLQKKEQELVESETSIERLRQIKNDIDILDEKLKNEVKTKLSNSEKIHEIKERLQILMQQIDDLGEIAYEKADIEKDIQKNSDLILEKSNELTKLETSLQQYALMISEIQSDMKGKHNLTEEIIRRKQLLQKHKEFQEQNIDIESKQNVLLKEKERVNKEIMKHTSIIDSKNTTIKKVSELDNCPLCMQEVSHQHKSSIKKRENENIEKSMKIIKSLEDNIKILDKEIEHGEIIIKKLNTISIDVNRLGLEIKDLERQGDELVEKTKRLNELLKKEKDAKQKLEGLGKLNLDGLQKKNKELKDLLDKISARTNLLEKKHLYQKSLEELEKEQLDIKKTIGDINKKKMGLSEAYSRYNEEEEKHSKLKSSLKGLQEIFQEKDKAIVQLLEQEKNSQRIIALISDDVEKKQKIKESMQKLQELLYFFTDIFQNIVSSIENHVMMKIHQEFNHLFQKWFSMLVESEIMSSYLRHDFSPVIEQNGYDIEVENLSGGEKTAVALAYRLSLNRVINDIIGTIMTKDLIILDEPTDGFSDQQLDKVREVLDELGIAQLILVSHENKLESFVNNVIRIGKSDHISRIIA